MGLDVKEKRLIIFFAKNFLPFILGYAGFATYYKLWDKPATLIGWVTISGWLWAVVKFLYKYVKIRVFRTDLKAYGKWALVTGATAGIGEAFAYELAAQGMNVILVSRSLSKLQDVEKNIKAQSPQVAVKLIAYDYQTDPDSEPSRTFYKELVSLCKGLEGGLGLLVNNVGIVNGEPDYVHLVEDDFTYGMLRVNVEGTVRMTRTIVPIMAERRKGAIINVSSGSGNHPTPMISVYASTKAFITEFSECLSYELRDFGIDVLGVTPYYVISNQFKRSKPTLLAPSAQRFVQDTLPLLKHEYRSHGYFPHAVGGALADWYWDVGGGCMMVMQRTRARMAEKNQLKTQKQGAGTKRD